MTTSPSKKRRPSSTKNATNKIQRQQYSRSQAHLYTPNEQALAGNVSVKALDLSHNMIGDKETYNFVRPDYTTGGEAVAEMIEVRRCLSLCRRHAYAYNPNPSLHAIPTSTCTICCDRVDHRVVSVPLASFLLLLSLGRAEPFASVRAVPTRPAPTCCERIDHRATFGPHTCCLASKS